MDQHDYRDYMVTNNRMFQFGHSIMMEDCWNWLNCDKLTCCAVSA